MLYRLEKLGYLLAMLRDQTMSLSHPSQWPDPYESEFLRAKRIRRNSLVVKDGRVYSNLPRLPGSVTRLWISENYVGRSVFASCFTEVAESERQWNAVRADGRVRWAAEPSELLTAFRENVKPGPVSLLKVRYDSTVIVDKVHREYAERYAGKALKGRQGWQMWCDAVLYPLSIKRNPFRDEHEPDWWLLKRRSKKKDVLRNGRELASASRCGPSSGKWPLTL